MGPYRTTNIFQNPVLWILNFGAVISTGNVVTYKAVEPGSYDANDLSVTMENVTEPWKTTHRACSVRYGSYHLLWGGGCLV